jgi:opacity protein-like surface antigen
MKGPVIGGLAVAALLIAAPLSAANAADMALKAPPAAPPAAYNWTGFYVGAEGGGGWGRAEDTDVGGFDSGPFSLSGGLIGGTVGYNWQIDKIVLGLEGDGFGAWIKGSTVGTPPLNLCGGAPSFCESDLQALGTFRGRAGVAIDRFLPYVTGGLAIGSLHGHEGDVLANGAVGPSAAVSRRRSTRTGRRKSNICISTLATTASSTMSFHPSAAQFSLRMSGSRPKFSAPA